MVVRPSRRAGRGQEVLTEGRQGSKCPPRGQGGAGRLLRRSWRGLEALLEGGKGQEDTSECRRGQEDLPEVQEWSGGPPGVP